MKKAVYLLALSLLIPWATAESQAKRIDLIKDESKVTYQISHPLHEIEASSKEVVYRLDIDLVKKEIKSVSAQVDVTTFDSGNSNRDSHAMEVIDAISYPEVRFTSTSVTQNGDSVKVAGKLTFHGVTNDIVIPAVARWSPNRLDVHGDFDVSLTAFKIERPSLLMIPVSDALKFIIVAAYRWD
jgi:polyisoprenoid-binding protein YceI